MFDRVRGVLPGVVEEGTHFLLPWYSLILVIKLYFLLIPRWQRSIVFDVRTKPRNISTTTSSRDMQSVSLTLRVLHRPDQDQLPTIYQRLGLDYDDRVLPSIGNEVLKAVIKPFN